MRRALPLLALLLAAAAVRLPLAAARDYVHDEVNTAIPLSQRISFTPPHVYLPLRAVNHPALPAYLVKASGALFGRTPFGYRLLHVIASLGVVAVVYGMTARWGGRTAGLWAAALLAFNDYFLDISARATAHVPYLLCTALAVYAFGRFLATRRAGALYASAVAVGVAFYCKEHAALLLPVFGAVLLRRSSRGWLRRPAPYAAAAVFALVIAPDVWWNLTVDEASAQVTYGERSNVTQATYRRHLQRVGGLGLSPYPAMFYLRDLIQPAAARLAGSALDDNTPEYHAMNPGLGLLLLGAVIVATAGAAVPPHDGRALWLALFWGVFGFFSLIRRGNPSGLDSVSWIWPDVTMIGAVALAGSCLAAGRGHGRPALWVVAAAAMAVAVWRLLG